MTDDLPNYIAIEPPDEKPLEEYTHHERRAALLRRVQAAGSPYAITQAREAERFGVHRSTISRDMDRLRESIDEHLGADAKLTTRVLFQSIVDDLLAADDWRAKKAAWDILMDWNDWLADLGAQHREPQQSALDVEMRSQNVEVAYQLVRGDEEEPLPTTESGTVDHDALGFTAAPPPGDETTPGEDHNA